MSGLNSNFFSAMDAINQSVAEEEKEIKIDESVKEDAKKEDILTLEFAYKKAEELKEEKQKLGVNMNALTVDVFGEKVTFDEEIAAEVSIRKVYNNKTTKLVRELEKTVLEVKDYDSVYSKFLPKIGDIIKQLCQTHYDFMAKFGICDFTLEEYEQRYMDSWLEHSAFMFPFHKSYRKVAKTIEEMGGMVRDNIAEYEQFTGAEYIYNDEENAIKRVVKGIAMGTAVKAGLNMLTFAGNATVHLIAHSSVKRTKQEAFEDMIDYITYSYEEVIHWADDLIEVACNELNKRGIVSIHKADKDYITQISYEIRREQEKDIEVKQEDAIKLFSYNPFCRKLQEIWAYMLTWELADINKIATEVGMELESMIHREWFFLYLEEDGNSMIQDELNSVEDLKSFIDVNKERMEIEILTRRLSILQNLIDTAEAKIQVLEKEVDVKNAYDDYVKEHEIYRNLILDLRNKKQYEKLWEHVDGKVGYAEAVLWDLYKDRKKIAEKDAKAARQIEDLNDKYCMSDDTYKKHFAKLVDAQARTQDFSTTREYRDYYCREVIKICKEYPTLSAKSYGSFFDYLIENGEGELANKYLQEGVQKHHPHAFRCMAYRLLKGEWTQDDVDKANLLLDIVDWYECETWFTRDFIKDQIAEREKRKNSSNSGGCYITTAICQWENKSDDCYELTQFRQFRDVWLKEHLYGEELINIYYSNAPLIVACIDKDADKDNIYELLKTKFLSSCLAYIEKKNYPMCLCVYIEMVVAMVKKYLPIEKSSLIERDAKFFTISLLEERMRKIERTDTNVEEEEEYYRFREALGYLKAHWDA